MSHFAFVSRRFGLDNRNFGRMVPFLVDAFTTTDRLNEVLPSCRNTENNLLSHLLFYAIKIYYLTNYRFLFDTLERFTAVKMATHTSVGGRVGLSLGIIYIS